MNEALARVRNELEAARRRAHALDAVTWAKRPAPAEWSAAECIVHLSLTSRAFVPRLRAALATARRVPRPRYRMDPMGALLWWALTLRVPTRTTEPFVPGEPPPREAVLTEFDALQDDVVTVVEGADGLELATLKIESPFDARVRYNVYAALRIVAAHQRLHLRQAERAAVASGK